MTQQFQPLVFLSTLISIPSFSGEEDKTADFIVQTLQNFDIDVHREDNNIFAFCKHYQENKPTLLLNSHHDTVKPSPSYTRNPFVPEVAEGKLYGLGSNDAGGCVTGLLGAFIELYDQTLPFNIVLAITAEEESLRTKGLEKLLPKLGKINCAIVGEPTQFQAAIAERGLLVLDAVATGKSGHAARNEGINAISIALEDIQFLEQLEMAKVSQTMGKVKFTVTMIQAGVQHNVIPDSCKFTVDIRTTDQYKNIEVVEYLQSHLKSSIIPRSVHLNASSLSSQHPLYQRAISLNIPQYVSPTTSDIVVLPCPALKIGVGNSERSHTANEFIYVDEVEKATGLYVNFIKGLKL